MKYPKAIGAYSVYREANGFIFASGQIPLEPNSGEVVSGGIEEQTKRVFENIKGVLEKNSLDFSNVIKTMVFLSDMSDFTAMNEVYATYFKPPYPARSAVGVKDLPKGVKVEIEIIAFKG